MNKVPQAILLLFASAIPALAADVDRDVPLQITYREQITNFWGDREVKLHLVVSGTEAFSGELGWSLHTGGRTLISRTVGVEIAAEGTTEVEVRYTLPTVKDAVVYPIELRAWAGNPGEKPQAQLRETFYLFGANPFVDRQEWLKSLKIHLLDSEQKTLEAFEKLEIPCERITNLATLDDLREGVLIVGEDLAWEDYGELGPTLLSAAARGVNVLCLANADAKFPLPAVKQDAAAVAQRLTFRRTDVLRDLDKRLSLHWTGQHAVVHHSLAVVAENDLVLARSVEPEAGWPWMEMKFSQPADKSSMLVWCGLGLIRSWEESPTPRYALLNWLEKVGDK